MIEQIVFARLEMPDTIADSDLAPAVPTDGMRWVRQGPASTAAAPALSAYRASELPPGFRLTLSGAETLGGASEPASHLVYSDGLATVSVFVEAATRVALRTSDKPAGTAHAGPGPCGSGFAFSTMVQGHEVTAVGEVPAQTVEFIAHPGQVRAAVCTAH